MYWLPLLALHLHKDFRLVELLSSAIYSHVKEVDGDAGRRFDNVQVGQKSAGMQERRLRLLGRLDDKLVRARLGFAQGGLGVPQLALQAAALCNSEHVGQQDVGIDEEEEDYRINRFMRYKQ